MNYNILFWVSIIIGYVFGMFAFIPFVNGNLPLAITMFVISMISFTFAFVLVIAGKYQRQ